MHIEIIDDSDEPERCDCFACREAVGSTPGLLTDIFGIIGVVSLVGGCIGLLIASC